MMGELLRRSMTTQHNKTRGRAGHNTQSSPAVKIT